MTALDLSPNNPIVRDLDTLLKSLPPQSSLSPTVLNEKLALDTPISDLVSFLKASGHITTDPFNGYVRLTGLGKFFRETTSFEEAALKQIKKQKRDKYIFILTIASFFVAFSTFMILIYPILKSKFL